MIKYILTLFSISFCSLAFSAETSASKVIDLTALGQESTIEFFAIVKPGALRIIGKGSKILGKLEILNQTLSGDLTVQLDEMTTGIELRDTHMKEKFLETKKYPNANLKIYEMKLPQDPFATSMKMNSVPFKGTLKVHDTESKVEGSADIDSTGPVILVEVKTKTTISAHKIEKPSYLGVKVADEIDILAHLKLKK